MYKKLMTFEQKLFYFGTILLKQRSLNICGKTLKAYVSLKFIYISVVNTQYLTLYT